MMQAGMFVSAERFCGGVRRGIFTHFKREEDPSMVSGKFDEELARLSVLVDTLGPGSLVLFTSRSPPPMSGSPQSWAATSSRPWSTAASTYGW
jgi:hypothetical protein